MKFKEIPGHVFLGREGNPSQLLKNPWLWMIRTRLVQWCPSWFLGSFPISEKAKLTEWPFFGIITHCSRFVGGCCHIGMIRLGWIKETILPFQLDYWTVDRNVIPGTGSTVEGSDLAADFLSAAHEQEETHGSLAGTSTTVTSIQMAERWWHAVTWPSYGHGCVITSYPYYKSVWLCLESETYHVFVVCCHLVSSSPMNLDVCWFKTAWQPGTAFSRNMSSLLWCQVYSKAYRTVSIWLWDQ